VVAVLGLDIGGANTKAAYVRAENGVLKEVRATSEYFPVWKNPDGLGDLLSKLAKKTIGKDKIDAVGLTMTAELSDAYETKRQGVNKILSQVTWAFQLLDVFVLDIEGGLRTLEAARMEPLKVAAANWAATGWLVSRIVKNCIVVDIGSTSTSIIPVVAGVVSAAGQTDLEKLINGELVYSGGLRTNVAAIVNSVPVGADVSRVSSELFATSGDVHLILGNITAEEFTVETTDGKGKTRAEALARLARVVCADVEMLREKEIVQIAQYVYERQVEQMAEGLRQVYQRIRPKTQGEVTVVVTGFGKNFLARKAAEKVGFKQIVDFDAIVLGETSKFSTAVGVACMVANNIEGEITQWKPS
jgi:probable H4MPT-linked C1 transfer pathway protein